MQQRIHADWQQVETCIISEIVNWNISTTKSWLHKWMEIVPILSSALHFFKFADCGQHAQTTGDINMRITALLRWIHVKTAYRPNVHITNFLLNKCSLCLIKIRVHKIQIKHSTLGATMLQHAADIRPA